MQGNYSVQFLNRKIIIQIPHPHTWWLLLADFLENFENKLLQSIINGKHLIEGIVSEEWFGGA